MELRVDGEGDCFEYCCFFEVVMFLKFWVGGDFYYVVLVVVVYGGFL